MNNKFLLYASGILFLFVAREYIVDGIYSTRYGPSGERFVFSLFLVLLQSIINCLFALAATAAQQTRVPDRATIRSLSLVAVAQVLATFLGNKANEYVDVTTKTLMKSMKPLAVMLVALLHNGRRIHRLRVLGIALLTIGLAVFMHNSEDARDRTGHTLIGSLLSIVALALDGFVGSTQDATRAESSASLMFVVNAWAFLLSLPPLIIFGEFAEAVAFVRRFPNVLPPLLLYCAVTPIATHIVFLTIVNFGALRCSIVTTCRKFLTILVNTLAHGRHLSASQVASVGVLFTGLLVEQYGAFLEKR